LTPPATAPPAERQGPGNVCASGNVPPQQRRQLPSGGVHVIQDYSGNLREHQSQYFQAPIQAPIKVDCATSCTAHNEDISDGECGAIKVMQDRALSHGFDNVDGLGKQIQLIHEVKAYLEENFKLKVVYDNSTNT
jgi:hypothetical protein